MGKKNERLLKAIKQGKFAWDRYIMGQDLPPESKGTSKQIKPKL